MKGETQRSPCEQDSSPKPCWTSGDDARYQLLHSSTHHVPIWFGISEPHAARLEGNFVIAADCMWCSPRKLENAIWSRFNHRSMIDPSIAVPRLARTLSPMSPEADQPTTSMIAEFGIDLAPCISIGQSRVIIAAAWAFAVSKLYRRPDVLIEFLDVAADEANFITNHRVALDLSPCGQGRRRRVLDSLLGSSESGSTLKTEPTADLSVPDSNQTAIREHILNDATAPGGLRLLQRRTYYPYDTALEWEAVDGKFRFRVAWDVHAYNETNIKNCINDFRQELRKSHGLLISQRSLERHENGSAFAHALTSKVTSGIRSAEVTHATDNVTDHDPYEISADDRKTMLEFNSRQIPVATRTISQLVSDSYARQPEALAVASWDKNLSYKTLNDLSLALAGYLRKTVGTQPTAILTVFNKSALAVVALLAILRSGHYYIPVDSSHPLSRKKMAYEQTRCRAILSSVESKQVCEILKPDVGLIITWDFLQTLPHHDGGELDASNVDGLCVVLFTSGSTGKPKGVLLKHRAVSTSLQDHGAYIGLDCSSRMLSFASYAFDAHLWDTWTCLIYGGTVCIPNESERMDDLQGYINRAQVTIGLLMPAALQYLEPHSMPHLQKLAVGGEAVTKSHLSQWEGSSTKVFEAYGPTECSVFSTLNMQLSANDPSVIGKPVGGSIWITDPADVNRLLPCGTEGELVITGQHLAEGYLDNIEKTEASFVTPAWPDWVPGGRRAYRTGDLAVLDSGGTLRIRGRMDGQIKLSGLRIERAELEHHIASCEMHASLPVVEKVETAPGINRIVCFLVPKGLSAPFCAILPSNEELSKIEVALREHLARQVPAGWIPSSFVFITKMPLNTSDKVDRQHLLQLYKNSDPSSCPPPQTALPRGGPEARVMDGVLAATSEIKTLLREAWSQVLGTDVSHIRDGSNFVQLGGSSISAIKLVAVLRKQNVGISTSQVLARPVLMEQASLINSNQDNNKGLGRTRASTPEPFELL